MALVFVISASVSWADELPSDSNAIQTLTVEQAEELVRRTSGGGVLQLNGLRSLAPEIASALANGFGTLSIDGLASLSDQAAEALARHEGGMSLGMTTLSDSVAEVLARSPGFLRLPRLTEASPKALAVLKARGPRLLMPLTTYSPLEQFLWGVTGLPKLLLLASLIAMVGCVGFSVYLSRRMSKAQELTLATMKKTRGLGQSVSPWVVLPWSTVESYSWKRNLLMLTVRPGRPLSRYSESRLVTGVVPPEQQKAAHAFVSARMPGEGSPDAS